VRSESHRALRLWYVNLVVSIEAAVKCAVVSPYSVVKQRLKCNTGKVCNCLIRFLRTIFCKCTATFRTHCITPDIAGP
jgi:hypothetical protein